MPTGPDLHRVTVPVELTHFVGRERELSALRQLAGAVRLLTLTGAGGSGKSRLALELVRPLDGAVAWIELAPLADAQLLPDVVLHALGSSAEGGAAGIDSVIRVIGRDAVTLVLDNCEHLVESCAAFADRLLRACPNVRIIATSREALGVAGERAWLVPPLALPDPDADLDALADTDAVRLFIDRARDVLPDFDITTSNASAIAEICRRLDGIPLAIELAAARVRHMSPGQIRDRMNDAFALLRSSARTALPRHRTLRAAIDWSYDLLPRDARIVLRRLSVFRGGFTLDMVERVAAGPDIEPAAVLDLIAMLADRSLIVVREQHGVARYQLLETMRQYAAQRLDEAGEVEAVRRRFADAVTGLVARVEPSFTTPTRRAAFAELEPELDNMREVLAWTREQEPDRHVRLVGMLWWFWFSTRHWVEAGGWIDGALQLTAAAAPSRERAALLFAAGALGALRARGEAVRPLLEEAVALAAAHGDGRLEAYSLNYLAMTWAATLSPRALEYTRRAEPWLRAHGDAYGLRLNLLLGGMAEQGAGNMPGAIARMEEAVRIARTFGQDRELAVALQTFATVLLAADDGGRAAALFRESLIALSRDPSHLFIARAIDYYAASRADREPAAAARMIGIAAAMRDHIGAVRFAHDEQYMSTVIDRLRQTLGADEYDRCVSAGMRVPPARAIDEALAGDVVRDVSGNAAADVPATGPARPDPEAPSATELDVRALGPLAVTVERRPISSWPYAKPRELLLLLLLRPEGRTRAELVDALWPDAAPAQARNSFHVTMHHLRRTLGHPDWIVLDRERYRLAPAVAVSFDVTSFEDAAQRALALDGGDAIVALRSALSLYRGHFLDGESAGAWSDEVQDRLRRTYCDAGIRLGRLLEAAGDAAGAAAAYERVVAHEPLHEEAHRGLLRTLAVAGRRAHAIRHFERLVAQLEDLELDPEQETLDLYERIRKADFAGS